ncbi:Inactive rhomboid protein 1 [Amphibalanus amphitrite]|uniref:Inactive rhomboid protein 1 n=1 Tax=Amphibalanus amphitrite TaxID=1232801 RepID=A0A6A4UZ19_AMPAM|nr:Inactive rhomboid protein 1 [Amphibalanus amphitrite]
MSSVSDASGGTPGSGVDDVTPSRASHVTSADSRRESQASRSDGTDHELIENPMYEMEGPGKRKSAESPSSVRVSPKDERLTSEPRDRPEVKRWHSVPVGHVVRTDQQPTRARPPLQPQLSRVDRVKSYMKRGTKQFFGLDDECDDENQCRWLDRRRRLAAKAYGRLKDDSDHPQMSLPAGYGADVTDSMGGTLHRRRHKDNVGKMTLQGLGYVATLVARGRLARGSQQRTSSRSYPPSATVEAQSAEETAFDERDGPAAGHGGGFKAQSRWAAAAAAVTVAGGRRQAAPELAADEVFFDNVPSADGAGDVQDPLQTSRDGAQWQRPPADRDVTDAGPGVGNKRIWSQMLDRVFDNSNRRQYGRGLAGRLFGDRSMTRHPTSYRGRSIRCSAATVRGRSVRRSVTARSDVVAQMDDLEDHRPYFTYWVTTVQLLVMLISLACYGFGPIGFELQQQSGTVMDISLSVQQVDYWEPPNLWLGPRAADLIHLGAKFAPCMRRDEKIQKEIFRERRKERDTACCIRNDNSGCVQSAQADCSRTISTFKSWLRSGGHEGRVSGPVCGLDPHAGPPESAAAGSPVSAGTAAPARPSSPATGAEPLPPPPPAQDELVVLDADSESKPARTREDEDGELQEAIVRSLGKGAPADTSEQAHLSDFCVEDGQSLCSVDLAGDFTYRLVGIVSHYGGATHSGHYVSDVYSVGRNRWYHYNDSRVSCVDEANVLGEGHQRNGYIFFYLHKDLYNQVVSAEGAGGAL